MVLLQLRTDNLSNTTLAKFDSIYDNAYIQFSNINNFLYLSGISNNSFKIYNPNYLNDEGLIYNSNVLNIRSLNTQIVKYNNYTTFPNEFTLIDKYVLSEPSAISQGDCSRCFDMNSSTFWISANIYSPTDGLALVADTNKFQSSYGHWIKIKFPYSIIPIGLYLSSLNNVGDPLNLDIYVSNDDINWTKILEIRNTNIGNDFFFTSNTNFYLYITIVITRIVINPQLQAFQSFKIPDLRIYSQPIIHLDNNIKICKDNIYNVNSINTKQILLNNIPITSVGDINSLLITQAIDAFKSRYSLFWSNLGTTGYLDNSIVTKIAINSNVANAMLDINGDISYKQQSLNLKLSITNRGINLQSSYIYIGKITFNNNTKNYFKLSLILMELEKYYFQTINIYGYSLISVNSTGFQNVFNAYWDTSFDNTFGIQRIVDIVYVIDTILATKTSIKFYIKYNDLLNITLTQPLTALQQIEYINNMIYFDVLNTSSITDIEFIPRTTNEILGDTTVFFKANLINSIILNKNGSSFSNLSTSNLILNNSSFNSGNILMIDNNKNIIDSGISSNILTALAGIPNNPNKIVISDTKGSINFLNVSPLLLSNIDQIAKVNSKILISSNNLFEDFTINKNNLSNLNFINNTSNSILIINNNNELKTTTSVRIDNISNVLSLFNFNTNQTFAICNSNIRFNTIHIGNNIITSNFKYNRIIVNNREIADDIFKLLIKIPDYNDIIQSANNIIGSIYTNIRKYVVLLKSGYSISLEVDANDDNPDITKQVYRIFDKSVNTSWVSQANFLNYNATILSQKYGNSRTLYNDPLELTRCGAYIIIDLGINFVLNFYVIYVNYTNIINSIRDFRLYGFNYNTNIWDIIDDKTNIIFSNNLIPNVFRINKNNFNVYSKYAITIINSHNSNLLVPTNVSINGIEFYGYPLNSNFYSSNTITYNNENNIMTLLGYNNVGISNINPTSCLSIGNDLPTNSKNTLLSLNHPSLITNSNIETPIINITRSGSNFNNTGIKAIHYLNSWYESNTNYTIKLTHSNINNENVVLSMNSDAKIAIGGYPDSNASNNAISIFNSGLSFYRGSNFINFQTSNISSNYNVILPPYQGIIDTTFYVDRINSNNMFLTFDDPVERMVRRPHIKFGNQTITARKENNVVIQIAGNCLIGCNLIDQLNANYLKNTLCVAGTIYSTIDISTDSDLSYKYNINLINDPLTKINKINGYTFNRYDTNDNKRYSGLIAQEVLKVMPEVIIKKHDGKYRIIYNNLAGLFVEGIKQLDLKTNYLNFKINLFIGIFSIAITYLYLQ